MLSTAAIGSILVFGIFLLLYGPPILQDFVSLINGAAYCWNQSRLIRGWSLSKLKLISYCTMFCLSFRVWMFYVFFNVHDLLQNSYHFHCHCLVLNASRNMVIWVTDVLEMPSADVTHHPRRKNWENLGEFVRPFFFPSLRSVIPFIFRLHEVVHTSSALLIHTVWMSLRLWFSWFFPAVFDCPSHLSAHPFVSRCEYNCTIRGHGNWRAS